jgi:exodeoxyribonuclease VII large subunit
LVAAIRCEVERTHFAVWVEGEVSNCRPAPSGHLYFTLKDGEAQLPVVLFRRQAQLQAAQPKDGDAVEIRGRVSIYESRGQLQLIAETVELRGVGALELAFKRLKARLQAEGLFAEERKRTLPAFPQCLGVITSPKGAVIRDILQVLRRRHGCLNILVYPAPMQGAACARGVVEGIRWFNRNPGRVDLILLARGGGSLEDLAGFNDEELARAIHASELPVVSAIGHETDFTIADFVADLRAPTPSAAAELVTAAQHRIEERVEEMAHRVQRAARFQLMAARQRFTALSADSALLRTRDAVSRRGQRLDELEVHMAKGMERRLRGSATRLDRITARLGRQDPALRLAAARSRWSVTTKSLDRLWPLLFAERLRQMDRAAERLRRIPLTASRSRRLEAATGRLEALSPLAVLDRGYALIYNKDGLLLRSAVQTSPGQVVRARLAAGTIHAIVKEPSA